MPLYVVIKHKDVECKMHSLVVLGKLTARSYLQNPFWLYADDAIVHRRTKAKALTLKENLDARFRECGLEIHSEKKKIVAANTPVGALMF